MNKIKIIILSLTLCANYVCAQGWVKVGCGFNNQTYVLYADSLTNKLFVGGWFSGLNCQSDSLLAVWDGTAWDTNYGINGANYNGVLDIINYKNEIYICGDLEYANGIIINGIAKWNGSLWDTLGSGFQN